MPAKKPAAKPTAPKKELSLLDQLKAGEADTTSVEFQNAIAQVLEHLNGNAHFEPKIS